MAGAVIGIGTNTGSREENLRAAVAAAALLPSTGVIRVSSVYETEPVGFTDQPDFLNIGILLDTGLSPRALLGACLGIEAGLGRVRTIKNGPRIIDIDLLLYENEVKNTQSLVLPHPRMMERDFVLKPLLDLNFDSVLDRKTVENSLSNSGVRFYCSKNELI